MKAHLPLTRSRIVEAALHIVDSQGLRRLTMRRLGDALEVEAMAIYHHMPGGKDELLDALVEHITVVPDLPADQRRDWREDLYTWCRSYRRRLLAHAGVLPLLLTRAVRTPATLRSLEAQYRCLTAGGLRGQNVADAAATLNAYVLGMAALQAQAPLARPEGPAPGAPHVLAAHAAAVEPDWDARFEGGLRALVTALTRHGG